MANRVSKTTKTKKTVLKPKVRAKGSAATAATLRAKSKAPAKSSPPQLRSEPGDFDLSAHKFTLAPESPVSLEPQIPDFDYMGELPESYGSGRLYLVSRDPYWVFSYWDLTRNQYEDAARSAHDGKVFLQVYLENGERVAQLQIHGGSKDWYVQVGRPDSVFYAELGYYQHDGAFRVISKSGTTKTPRDTVSSDTRAKFVTIPFHYSFRQLGDLIARLTLPGEELAEALARLQVEGFDFPFEVGRHLNITAGQQQALYDYLGGDIIRRIQRGSEEITEILRKRFAEMQSSGQWTSSGGWPTSSQSSPFGGYSSRPRNFFMNVNAELIIYGGTDPEAKVRIAGEDITLESDGTFRFHFKFPDGRFHIPIEATSPDGAEVRSALLSFLRLSEYAGRVDATAQPPLPEPFGRSS